MPKSKTLAVDNLIASANETIVSSEAASSEVIVCGAPTSELARRIPNEETVKALQDTEESHKLSDYDSLEAFMQAILDS